MDFYRLQNKLILLILTIICFSPVAKELTVVKEPITFNEFWNKSEELKEKYTCAFDKINNPNFQFLFTVMNEEKTQNLELDYSSIYSEKTIKYLKSNDMELVNENNTFSDVLCVTDQSAIVLRRSKAPTKGSGYASGFIWLAKYKYEKTPRGLKIMIHKSDVSDYEFHLNKAFEIYMYHKIEFKQVTSTGK